MSPARLARALACLQSHRCSDVAWLAEQIDVCLRENGNLRSLLGLDEASRNALLREAAEHLAPGASTHRQALELARELADFHRARMHLRSTPPRSRVRCALWWAYRAGKTPPRSYRQLLRIW